MAKEYGWDNSLVHINFDIEKYSKDKKTIADTIGTMVFDIMQSAFHIEGLPETIPEKWLKLMLMRYGFSVIGEYNGKLYAFIGGLGGELDEYYQPTLAVIANPYLNFSAEWKIKDDVEAVLVSNDTMRAGLVPLVGKYAGLLAENTVSIRIADIMARVTNILSGGDESTIESANEYLRQVEEGKLGVIQENPFTEDLKVNSASSEAHQQLTDLIELEQYLKASLFNILGLQANYNMKRESLNSNEAQLNDDATKPLIENMLNSWREGFDRVNARFGTNITVDYAGVWKQKQEEEETENEQGAVEEAVEESTEGEQESVPEVEEGDGTENQGVEGAETDGEPAGTDAGEVTEEAETPEVKIEINIENAEEVKTEEEEDGNPDESENIDGISDGGDSNESESTEDGGMADSDDDRERDNA